VSATAWHKAPTDHTRAVALDVARFAGWRGEFASDDMFFTCVAVEIIYSLGAAPEKTAACREKPHCFVQPIDFKKKYF
jgi:hypothetical protein